MAQWLIVRNGKEYGPIDEAKLRELAASGKVLPDDLVRQADGTKGKLAKDIDGLLGKLSPSASAATPGAQPTKKSKVPWVTIIVFVGLSLSVARLLNAFKKSRLRDEGATTQTVAASTRPKRHTDEPSIERSGDQGSETLTADYLPSRAGATWTMKHTMHKARDGSPDVVWRVTCKETKPGEIDENHTKLFPSEGESRTKQVLQSQSEQTVQKALIQGNAAPTWAPLIYLGAHVGDKWRDGQNVTYTLKSLTNSNGKTLAEIESNAEVTQAGTRTGITTTYTLQKGVGILKSVRRFSVNGVDNPYPSYTEERE